MLRLDIEPPHHRAGERRATPAVAGRSAWAASSIYPALGGIQRPEEGERSARQPAADVAAWSAASAARTASNDAMATSIWSRVGCRVVIFCSHRPGAINTRITSERWNFAPR